MVIRFVTKSSCPAEPSKAGGGRGGLSTGNRGEKNKRKKNKSKGEKINGKLELARTPTKVGSHVMGDSSAT